MASISTNDIPSKSELLNKVQGVEKNLEKFSSQAGERLGEMASTFSEQASDQIKMGREFIKENPAKGVAIAAAAGVVAGSLLTLALRRRQ